MQENCFSCYHSENSRAGRSGLHLCLKAMKLLTEKGESSPESLGLGVFLTSLISAGKRGARCGFLYKGRALTSALTFWLLKIISCYLVKNFSYAAQAEHFWFLRNFPLHQLLSCWEQEPIYRYPDHSVSVTELLDQINSSIEMCFPLCIMHMCMHESSLFWNRKLQK